MKKTAIILLTSAALSGCASIIKGGSQDIDITTNNGQSVNATIFTKSGIQETNIPQTIAVQKDSQDITITVKEGRCNRESVTIAKSHIQPWFWGNMITGGILGSATDSLTGAMWQYDNTIVVNVDEKTTCK